MLDPDDKTIIEECKKAGAVLVTWDRVPRTAAGGITPYQVLEMAKEYKAKAEDLTPEDETALGRLLSLTPKGLSAMATGGEKTYALFTQHIAMTLNDAKLTLQLRVEEDYSWRAVARFWSQRWKAPWGSNQIAGAVICEKAAKMLGQDYMQPPWN